MSANQHGSDQEIRQILRNLITELAPGEVHSLTEASRLVEDLDYHSLALLELAFTIEDEFDLDMIDEEAARTIQSVRDVEDLVIAVLTERAALVPSSTE